MIDKIFQQLKQKLPHVQAGIALKNHTTYKIGGPAKYFFVAKTKDDLLLALEVAKNFKLPVFILGGGSNLLIAEKGFKGLVIKIGNTGIEFQGKKAFVGAGANITKLAYLSADRGLSGIEWAAGVPGTVGGSIYGNAQAFGSKISHIIRSVEAINSKTLEMENFSTEQCQFSLKNSIFKKNTNLAIVSAVLEFEEKSVEHIKSQIKEFLHYRRTKHPMEFPSAGSVFVNPEIKITNKKLLEKFPELFEYNEKGAIPAGYLIQKSGIQGKKIGKAQISGKHANFIVNLGGAKASDVMSLINLARKKVKKNFGITLVPEVQFVGFSKKW